MEKLRCMIVEDEPLAAEVLEDYINQLPHLELIANCPDAIFALDTLKREQIDVIFLDIHLPKLKGLDFLKTLKNPPSVILTTAYHQYALEGFELDVVDYLLKPIEFARFLKAVNKLVSASPPMQNQKTVQNTVSPSRFFKVNKKNVRVFLDEILFIESLKEYVKIYTKNQTLVTKFQLGEIEAYLDWDNLLRVHRSYLIAKDKVEAFTASEIEINGNVIPIGRSYKELVMRQIGN